MWTNVLSGTTSTLSSSRGMEIGSAFSPSLLKKVSSYGP